MINSIGGKDVEAGALPRKTQIVRLGSKFETEHPIGCGQQPFRRDQLVAAAHTAQGQICTTVYNSPRKRGKLEWAQCGMPADPCPPTASSRSSIVTASC